MEKSEVLRLMNDIVEAIPLGLEYAIDGRYLWPARWQTLFDQIET